MFKELLYQKICESITTAINTGKLSQHACIPTVKELMKEHSVSHRTVLRAYQELKKAGKIVQRGKRYVVCSGTEEMLRSQNLRIGVLIRPLWAYNEDDIFFNEIWYGFMNECGNHSVDIEIPASASFLNSLGSFSERSFNELVEDAVLMGRRADAFLFDERIPDHVIQKIMNATGKTGVLMNRYSEELGIDGIVEQTENSFSLLLSAVKSMPYEHLLIAVPSTNMSIVETRFEVLRKLLKKSGRKEESYTFIGNSKEWTHDALMREITAFMLSFGKEKRIVVFAMTDGFARLLCNTLGSKGLQAGRDFGIAGFGGLGAACHYKPKITTVRVNATEMGRMGLQALIQRLTSRELFSASALSPVPLLEWGETLGE